jgi:hypothetical protein
VSSCREREWRAEERIADQWLWARDWWVAIARRTAITDWWEESNLVARGVVVISLFSSSSLVESGVWARHLQLHLSQQSQ